MIAFGTRNSGGRRHLLAVAAVLTAVPALAQDVRLRAEVDRSRIALDEQIQLDVVVEGRFRSVEDPQRPPLDDFDVYPRGRTQSMQVVNGEFTASVIFTYILVPKREGTFTIGPFRMQSGGSALASEPITIHVGGGQAPRGAPAPAPGTAAEREDRDVFVLARVDKQEAFVNEQILYTFYLYRAVQLSNLSYSAPGFQGFWVEKLKDSEKQYYKVLNGRRYLVTELVTAIFPTTSGTLVIDPATLQVVVLTSPFGFSLFDRGVDRILKTRPIELQVQPLPAAGKPALFDGAVGEGLTLAAVLDRTEVEEGEPVTLKITVEGSGNVKTFSRPRLPDLPAFKVYDSDSKTDVQATDRVYGSRTYETVLVPRDEGDYSIGPVRLAYFDTRESRYRVLQTKPMQVTAVRSSDPSRRAAAVNPGLQQRDIQVLGRDIAHIRSDVPVRDARTPLYRHGLFGALVPLPLAALALAAVRQRQRRRLAADVALARSSRAAKLARKHLAAAERELRAGRGAAFYAEVSRALRQYAGDKLNVSPAGLTQETLRDHLLAAGVPMLVCGRLLQLLERCDAARFAPGSQAMEALREALAEAQALLVQLDASWKRRGRHGATTAAAVLLAAGIAVHAGGPRAQVDAGGAAPGELPASSSLLGAASEAPGLPIGATPEELLRHGHAAYEAGSYSAAIEAYERAERAGVRNGALYYNLGNAYYKNEQLGLAVASYRRAEMLSPRDRLLRSNLEYVLARREDKAVQAAQMPLVAALRRFFDSLSLNEWLAAATAAYVLVCALLLVRVVRRPGHVAFHIAERAGIVLLVVFGLAAAAKIYAVRGIHRGVVATPRVAVMSGPGTSYTVEFSIHEGTDLRIEEARPGWLRVSVGGRLRGWVPADTVIRI